MSKSASLGRSNLVHPRSGLWPVARQISVASIALMLLSSIPLANAATAGKALFIDVQNPPAAASVGQTKKLEQLKKEKTTAGLQLVNIDVAALAGESIQMQLDPSRNLTYVKTRIEQHGANNFIWFGTHAGGLGTAILVVRNNIVTGSVNYDGKLYKIESVGDGVHAFIEINIDAFPKDHPAQLADRRRSTTTTPTPTTTTTTTPTTAAGTASMTADGKAIIDVLVAYPSTVTAAVADVASLITLAVAETNQAYVNSGARIYMNLIGTMAIPYSETGKDYPTMLSDLAAMPDVKTKRDTLGADVVVMLSTNSTYCGYAYLGPYAANAFGVVNKSCATGYYSFGHEIGHMQGLNHDPIASPGTTPYAYGHGYQSSNASPSWRTIMAYNCSPSCSRLQYFSNPNLNYNGLAMGTPTVSDNTRVLNETAATVSAFRSRPVP